MSIIKADLSVPLEHLCFEAHFPGNPVVPGALLLQWLVKLARQYFADDVVGIKSMKFVSVIKPGDKCVVFFEKQANISSIKIKCCRGDEVVCKGVLLLGNPGLGG